MRMNLRTTLRDRQLIAPGVYDALTASIAASAGFEALYVSGGAIAYTKLGRPDIGLVSMNEVVDTIALIRDRVDLPLVVDADNGYGNALNVQRTVRMFERAGANAIQLEDQTLPKRCGHLRDKSVVPAAEMVGKIRAAVDARSSEATLIVARTDAVAVEGLEPAIDRARRYAEAGADVLFVEAPQNRDQLALVGRALAGTLPLLANMVDGGDTPNLPAADLAEMGFRLVIFPGGIVRALLRTMADYYGSLATHRSNQPFADRMLNFKDMKRRAGHSGNAGFRQKLRAVMRDTALLLVDLQNDFIHPQGAYARGGPGIPEIAALPARLAPLAARVRAAGGWVVATQFTLVPARDGEPLISPHLLSLRPFLRKGDFLPGAWGHQVVDELGPIDLAVEKIAYNAFYMTRLEWVLRRCGITRLIVGRHRYQRGRCLHGARCACARYGRDGAGGWLCRLRAGDPSDRHRRPAPGGQHFDGVSAAIMTRAVGIPTPAAPAPAGHPPRWDSLGKDNQ